LKQLLTEGLILSTLGQPADSWLRTGVGTRSCCSSRRAPEWRCTCLGKSTACDVAERRHLLDATLIVGLVPSFQTRNIDLAGALKAESSGVVEARGRAWVRSGLVVFQVCLSFILLVGAALLRKACKRFELRARVSQRQMWCRPGSLISAGYDVPHAKDFSGGADARVRALPGGGVRRIRRVTPLGYGTYSSTPIAVDGYQPPLEEQPTVDYNQVSPDYFATLGIPLLSGREFTRRDDENAPLVA